MERDLSHQFSIRRNKVLNNNGLTQNVKPVEVATAPSQWSHTLQHFVSTRDRLTQEKSQLMELQEAHLQFRLNQNDAEEMKLIEDQTKLVNSILKQMKNCMDQIQTVSDPHNQEQILVNNAKNYMLQQFNETFKAFSDDQRAFHTKLEEQRMRRQKNQINYLSKDEMQLDPQVQSYQQMLETRHDITEEQAIMLLQNKQDAVRRHQQLKEVMLSVEELNELFKEFNAITLQQGELLDQIDVNLELTMDQLKRANKDLETAKNYQEASTWWKYLIPSFF